MSGLDDYWVFSNTLSQWKKLGGNLDSSTISPIFGETNVYHQTNRLGTRYKHVGTKINEEEIMIFGGWIIYGGNPKRTNIVQKYNVSMNLWKTVSKNQDFLPEGYSRDYNSRNYPGNREFHKIWKINAQEIILFGGLGENYDGTGSMSDLFSFNFKLNLWKFIGKEETKYKNRPMTTTFTSDFSESTLLGSRYSFIGQFREKNNDLIICTGYGYSVSTEGGKLDDCYKIFLGNMCNLLEETDPTVCSSKGKCLGNNNCQCNDEFFGSDCELTKCNGILSNETGSVCSGKGICANSQCLCYEQSFYNKLDCTKDEALESFMQNLWMIITFPIVFFWINSIAYFRFFSFCFYDM